MPITRDEPCVIDGCTDRQIARGWCWRHYQRWRRHGDPRINWRELDALIDDDELAPLPDWVAERADRVDTRSRL